MEWGRLPENPLPNTAWPTLCKSLALDPQFPTQRPVINPPAVSPTPALLSALPPLLCHPSSTGDSGFFKCLPFELPEDVVNKTLQIILELQFFKLSLFDLCCHNSSKTFQQPFISAIKSYSFRLFSSLPVSHLLWSSQSFGHQKAINGFDMPLPVAVCSGLVNPLAPRKGAFGFESTKKWVHLVIVYNQRRGRDSRGKCVGLAVETAAREEGMSGLVINTKRPGGLGSRGGGKPRRVCWFAGFTAARGASGSCGGSRAAEAGGCWVLAAKQPLAAFGFV
ncbi:hypothetical protein Tco_0488422 [Tanacetum coccineum]